MEREDLAFHTRVHEAFLNAVGAAWQADHPEIGSVVTVDARGTVDDVAFRCAEVLATRWPSRFGALVPARAAMNANVEVARG